MTALPLAPSREPCSRCGIPGFRGCAHQLQFEPGPLPEFRRELPESRRESVMPSHFEDRLLGGTGRATEGAALLEEVHRFIRNTNFKMYRFLELVGQDHAFIEKARGGRLEPETILKIRAFIASRRELAHAL